MVTDFQFHLLNERTVEQQGVNLHFLFKRRLGGVLRVDGGHSCMAQMWSEDGSGNWSIGSRDQVCMANTFYPFS